MSEFFNIVNFILHSNYDHSFCFNGHTVYAVAEYEGKTGIARNFPSGAALYLVLENGDRNFIVRYREYFNDNIFECCDPDSIDKFKEATLYYINRNKELREQGVKGWDATTQIEAEIITKYIKS